MACFLVPGTEAIVVTAVALAMKSSYTKKTQLAPAGKKSAKNEEEKAPFFHKLMWLAKLLWGGVFLLCFEHIWHGEVQPFAPFLTAMADPGETQVMLAEMKSVGGTMAIWITTIWLVMVVVSNVIVKRESTVASVA